MTAGTIRELAEATGRFPAWLYKIMPELLEAGIVEEKGIRTKYIPDMEQAIDYINSRKETRGRPKQ